MICPKCNVENPEDASFCRECGAPVEKTSPVPEAKEVSKGWLIFFLILIVAMMAAILIPNLLPDSTPRSPVSRVKSDLRTMATGIEAYNVDYGIYPIWNPDFSHTSFPIVLTTPIAWLATIPQDHFAPRASRSENSWGIRNYKYFSTESSWILWSAGPDGDFDLKHSFLQDTVKFGNSEEIFNLHDYYYDPSNGTKSNGDIYHLGGLALDFVQPNRF